MLQTITKVYKQTNKRLAFYLHYLKRNMFICSEFKKIKVNDHFLLLHWTLISCYHHPLQGSSQIKQLVTINNFLITSQWHVRSSKLVDERGCYLVAFDKSYCVQVVKFQSDIGTGWSHFASNCACHPWVQTSQKQGTFLLLQKLTKMVNAIYSLGHRHLFCSRGICLNTSPQQYIIDVNWFLFLISFTWTSSCTYAAVIVLKRSLPGVSLMSKSKNNIKIFFFIPQLAVMLHSVTVVGNLLRTHLAMICESTAFWPLCRRILLSMSVQNIEPCVCIYHSPVHKW